MKNTNDILRGEAEVKERGFISHMKNSESTPTPVKKMIEGTYVEKSIQETKASAEYIIKNDPTLAENMALNPRNDVDLEIGNLLLHKYMATGDLTKANALSARMAEQGTEFGRAIRIFQEYDKTTPQGALRFAQQTINRYNKAHPENPLNITDKQIKQIFDKAQKIQEMPEGKNRNISSRELMEEVNKLVPSTIVDKGITVWKAGLLTSPRTTLRNLGGNTIHQVAEIAKDAPAAIADRVMQLKTGKRQMTFTLQGELEGIVKGWEVGKNVMKYGFDPEDAIAKFDIKKVSWGSNPVEQGLKKYTDFVFNWMSAQDKPFFHAAFARSLYDQAGAAAINAGKQGDAKFVKNLVDNPTPEMKMIAAQDASLATFKDVNALTKAARSFKEMGNGNEVLKFITENVAPFTGVPTSIAGQMIAYSPLGLLKGSAKVLKVLSGKVLESKLPLYQRQAAQEFGRGTIGTGIFAIGAYLMQEGLMTGKPKDAKEAAQWDLEGKQANSVMINGKWRSINSIGPEALILLAGSKYQENTGKDVPLSEKVSGTASAMGQDFMSQTFLSGVQQPLNAISDPARYGGTYLKSQAGSITPNVIKDWSKSADPLVRETNSASEQFQSTIPYWRNSLNPRRDVLGKETPNELQGIGAFVDLFNSRTPIKGNPVVDELSRLFNAGDPATPSKLSKDQTINKKKLKFSPYQLDQLEASSGGKISQAFSEVIVDPEYQKLSDEEKVKVLNSIVENVRKVEKLRVASSNGIAEKSDLAADITKLTGDQSDYLQSGKINVKLPDPVQEFNPTTEQINSVDQMLSQNMTPAQLVNLYRKPSGSLGKMKFKGSTSRGGTGKIKIKVTKASQPKLSVKTPKIKKIKVAKSKVLKVKRV